MSLDNTADPGGSRTLRPGRPILPILALLAASVLFSTQSPAAIPSAGSDPGKGSQIRATAALAGSSGGASDAIRQTARGSFAPEPADGPALIRLDGGFEFDPQASPIESQIPLELRGTAPTGPTRGYFIVQFKGPITQDDRAVIESEGGRIHGYIPDYALLVSLTGSAKARVAASGRVSWSGLYQPAYKISRDPKMSERGLGEMDILLFPEESLDEVAAQITACRRDDPRGAGQRDQQDHPRRDRQGRRRGRRPDPAESRGSSRSSSRVFNNDQCQWVVQTWSRTTAASGTWGSTAQGQVDQHLRHAESARRTTSSTTLPVPITTFGDYPDPPEDHRLQEDGRVDQHHLRRRRRRTPTTAPTPPARRRGRLAERDERPGRNGASRRRSTSSTEAAPRRAGVFIPTRPERHVHPAVHRQRRRGGADHDEQLGQRQRRRLRPPVDGGRPVHVEPPRLPALLLQRQRRHARTRSAARRPPRTSSPRAGRGTAPPRTRSTPRPAAVPPTTAGSSRRSARPRPSLPPTARSNTELRLALRHEHGQPRDGGRARSCSAST